MKKYLMFIMITIAGTAAILTGCSMIEELAGKRKANPDEKTVEVQSVASITGVSITGVPARMPGVVVPQGTTEVRKDDERKILERKVSVGDSVKKGDLLFLYDVNEMKLSLDRGQLEIQRMKSSIDNSKKQVEELKKERKKSSKSQSTSYDIEIKKLELDISEQEFQLEQKKKEQEKLTADMGKPEVVSPVDGIVKKINETDSDSLDENVSDAYIVIMEAGNYRVKSRADRSNLARIRSGAGEKMKILSRLTPKEIWNGTLLKIEADSSGEAADTDLDEDADADTNDQSQVFYVSLEDSKGLMMGQHVFVEWAEQSDEGGQTIRLPSTYINSDDSGTYCWAMRADNKLERRNITVGKYDEEQDEYEILSGIEPSDYIALDEEGLKEGMKVTRYEDMEEDDEVEEDENDLLIDMD